MTDNEVRSRLASDEKLEFYRVLRPGARALILDTDWDSIAWTANR